MKDTLPVIPRPAAERWRDIRLRHVPVLVYLTGIVLVVYLWNTQWMPSSFTGEVQALTANIASPLSGVLGELSVKSFDRVAKGQIIGKVLAQTPEAANAGLSAIRANLLVTRASLSADGPRIQFEYQRVKVDQLSQKVDAAIARTKLRFAESELVRNEKLRAENIVSQFDYETALDNRDALAVEVKERDLLVAETEQVLSQMKPAVLADGNLLVLESIETAIRAEEEKFRQSVQSILRSPIDGVVTKVYRNNEENISAGEPLVSISGESSESIIGYVRQPISFLPKPGDVVVVRSRRASKREAADARIVKVGGRLEFFAQSLRVRGFDSSQERGLPVLISVPQELALYPGELVDLALKQ